jgi:hypothetical protein
MTDLLISQLTEPFRIGLLIALFATMLRTRANSGVWLPLAIGVVFVSVLIPLSHVAGAPKAPVAQEIGVGLAANVVLMAAIMGIWAVVQRLRSK